MLFPVRFSVLILIMAFPENKERVRIKKYAVPETSS
jgi:hypothetical protein